jgi:hypothetical protein
VALATPRTWVVGETVTAAIMNAEIRDQFNALVATTATGSSVVTIDPDWTLLAAVGIKQSDVIQILVRLSRAVTNITANTAGNLTDEPMFTVNAGWRPKTTFGTERLPFVIADGFGHGSALLSPDTGVCDVASWIPSQSITTDRFLRVLLTYPA